jgi:hypothetical protein
VVVQPSGDRLAGAAARPAKFEAVSGADGVATVEMPATTHFVVSAEGVEPTELLPDWTSEVRLVFTPSDRTVLRVRFAAAMPAAPRRICWSESLRAQLRQFAEAPAAEPRMFQLVRELGSAEALYVLIDPPADADERAVPLGQLAGPLPELRPGRQSLVDLRADAEPAADATALAEISKLADAIAAGASRRQ